MSAVDWRTFAEEMLRELDDLVREVRELDVTYVKIEPDGKSATVLDPLKVSEGELYDAEYFVDHQDAESAVEDFATEWRRRMYSAAIVADRRAA